MPAGADARAYARSWVEVSGRDGTRPGRHPRYSPELSSICADVERTEGKASPAPVAGALNVRCRRPGVSRSRGDSVLDGRPAPPTRPSLGVPGSEGVGDRFAYQEKLNPPSRRSLNRAWRFSTFLRWDAAMMSLCRSSARTRMPLSTLSARPCSIRAFTCRRVVS